MNWWWRTSRERSSMARGPSLKSGPSIRPCTGLDGTCRRWRSFTLFHPVCRCQVPVPPRYASRRYVRGRDPCIQGPALDYDPRVGWKNCQVDGEETGCSAERPWDRGRGERCGGDAVHHDDTRGRHAQGGTGQAVGQTASLQSRGVSPLRFRGTFGTPLGAGLALFHPTGSALGPAAHHRHRPFCIGTLLPPPRPSAWGFEGCQLSQGTIRRHLK